MKIENLEEACKSAKENLFAVLKAARNEMEKAEKELNDYKKELQSDAEKEDKDASKAEVEDLYKETANADVKQIAKDIEDINGKGNLEKQLYEYEERQLKKKRIRQGIIIGATAISVIGIGIMVVANREKLNELNKKVKKLCKR